METSYPVNWDLLNRMTAEGQPHRYFDPAAAIQRVVENELSAGTAECLAQTAIAHHVLDITGIPAVDGYGHDLDARVLQLVTAYLDVTSRLGRLADVHSRETGAGGTVGDYCIECGWRWPCHSYGIATNTATDDD